jgi:hypothetical protein
VQPLKFAAAFGNCKENHEYQVALVFYCGEFVNSIVTFFVVYEHVFFDTAVVFSKLMHYDELGRQFLAVVYKFLISKAAQMRN